MRTKRHIFFDEPARLLSILLAGWLLSSFPAAVQAQQFDAEIRATQARLDAARAAALYLIAPRTYERASERLNVARERYARGEATRAVRAALDEAGEALAQAERWGESAGSIFGGALAARSRARAADAPALAPEEWAEAERVLLEGGRRFERGDRVISEARAKAAGPLYSRAELDALRSSVLGRAREMREWAVATGAARMAPATLAEADELLSEADGLLTRDRTQISEAGHLGSSAAAAYRRAGRIASVADSVQQRNLAVETIVRRQEDGVSAIARPLHFEPDLSAGLEGTINQAIAAIRSLQEDRNNLQSDLARHREELERTRTRSDSLASVLSGLERREARLASQLREKERDERQLREIRGLFTPEEGEVLVRGDTLTIRLYGLTFETGSNEIPTEDFSLLTKLQQVLREFPTARVTVEGHTDSRGNDDANRALSQRRAIAVREHLLTSMPISSARITAVGRGEDRPVATNETAEGRKKNRRIEIVLDLSGG